MGAATARGLSALAKYPGAPQPGHDLSAAAEHRMHLAVRHLKIIGCPASDIVSDQDLGRRCAPGPGSPAATAPGQRLVLFAAGTDTKTKQ